MKEIIFTIWDAKAEAFLPPFFMHNENMAKRAFIDCVNDKQHAFHAHPEDYILHTVGIWKPETGTVIIETVPQPLISGIAAIKQTPTLTEEE